MKKLYILAALAISSLAANAQSLTLSTYSGTDVAKYNNQTMNVVVNRYMFKGWNTISLPFSMTAEQVNETFGADCRLEKLAGVENDGSGIKLNFQDCKSEGIKANTPYILNYTGESTTKRLKVDNALIQDGTASVTFKAAQTGETVTFAAASTKKEAKGLYGILAKDNAEASFVNVDNISTGFYATRCFIQVSSGNSTQLNSNHVEESTAISSIIKNGEAVDVYSIGGGLVSSKLTTNEINNLPSGIYVVKGKKVLVK